VGYCIEDLDGTSAAGGDDILTTFLALLENEARYVLFVGKNTVIEHCSRSKLAVAAGFEIS